jgi:hypothetical protein
VTGKAATGRAWCWAVQASVSVYFVSSVLYYIRPLPLGHLINGGFLLVFVLLAGVGVRGVVVSRQDAVATSGIAALAVMSAIAWVLRDAWDGSGLFRALTWLTPAALLVLLSRGGGDIDYGRIGRVTGVLGLVVNLAFTLLFARFNQDLGKFEVDLSWTAVSSNELSFHLVVFSALFLFLAGGGSTTRFSGAMTLLLSLVHLSKAHLGAALVAPLVALCRRRPWLLAMMAVVAFLLFRWVAEGDSLSALVTSQDFRRVLEPMVGMVTLVSGLLVNGEIGSAIDVAAAVGLHRLEVYEDAVGLLSGAWVGYPSGTVDLALRGLDPHSNLLYLALREGWLVTGMYLLLAVLFLARIDVRCLWVDQVNVSDL